MSMRTIELGVPITDSTPTHDQTGPVRLRPGRRTVSDRAGVVPGRPTRLLRPGRGSHCDGRVRRLQDRRHRASACRRWCTSVVVREGAVVRVSTVTWTRVMMVLAVVAVVTAAVVAVVRVVLNRRWGFGTCSGSARNIRAGPCYIPCGSDCGGGPATSGVSGPRWVH
jgi:hypothetical protein